MPHVKTSVFTCILCLPQGQTQKTQEEQQMYGEGKMETRNAMKEMTCLSTSDKDRRTETSLDRESLSLELLYYQTSLKVMWTCP